MERITLEISWASIWKVLIIGFVGFVLFLARDVIAALLLALIISAGLTPAVNYLERKKIPRILSTVGIFIALLLTIGLLIYAILPVLVFELDNLITTFADTAYYPEAFLNLNESAKFVDSLAHGLRILEGKLFSGDIQLIELTSNILGGLTLTFSVVIISFYLAASREGIERFLRAVLPEKSEEYVLDIFARVKHKIGRWFQTQIFLSVFIGVVTFVGLKILGVKYSLVLAFLAGSLEIIPFVGPIFAGALAAIVGFSDSTTLGIYVLILFLIIQQFESNVVIPLAFQSRVGLHPVLILSALLIGGTMAGVLGVILSIPIAVAIQEVIEDWSTRKGKGRDMLTLERSERHK